MHFGHVRQDSVLIIAADIDGGLCRTCDEVNTQRIKEDMVMIAVNMNATPMQTDMIKLSAFELFELVLMRYGNARNKVQYDTNDMMQKINIAGIISMKFLIFSSNWSIGLNVFINLLLANVFSAGTG